MNNLINCVKEHEGFSPWAYQDSLGYFTIGYGKLIDKRKNAGLTQEEAQYLLQNELNRCEIELSHFSWFMALDIVRQEVFIELCFNIGLSSLLQFKETITAVEAKNYQLAAENMLHSEWAKQVGPNRSNSMAQRLITGSYGV